MHEMLILLERILGVIVMRSTGGVVHAVCRHLPKYFNRPIGYG